VFDVRFVLIVLFVLGSGFSGAQAPAWAAERCSRLAAQSRSTAGLESLPHAEQ
jgi:hypothetical protein